MWLLDKFLNRAIRDGWLTVIDHDGSRHDYGEATDDGITIRLTDQRAAAHIARYPQLGAGEAFMRGWLVVEPPHDIRDLLLFVTRNTAAQGDAAIQAQGRWRRAGQALLARLDAINPRGRSARNAEHTYNLTRRLYELFLDEDRQYTMGYYRDPANSLEQAQVDKKAHIAAKLHLPRDAKGMRVLDIGCGWGGFALFLHEHYGCEVLGVALAPDQIAFCRERAEAAGVAGKVRFELMDYRDVTGSFDRISSVGLLEHVGIPQFAGFFEHTHRLLASDGVMVSHSCGRTGPPGRTDAWTRKYIFPGGYIPALSEIVTHSEHGRLAGHGCGGHALPLRPHAARLVRAHRAAPGRDRRDVRRGVLPHVAVLPRRGGTELPPWRDGQLAGPVCEGPRRPADDARLHRRRERPPARRHPGSGLAPRPGVEASGGVGFARATVG